MHSERIVYVEDDDDIREMMEAFLVDAGYVVASFRTAEAGLDELARARCDLLLTDYVLPGETGAWLVREAKARGFLEDVPVIFVSGEGSLEGVDGVTFLRKPVRAEVLLTAIDQALQTSTAAADVPLEADVNPIADLELTLYVATPSHESETAKRNLARIVRTLGPARIQVTIHDVSTRDDAALQAIEEDRIVVLPTLVKKWPRPQIWIAGDLSKPAHIAELLAVSLPALPSSVARPFTSEGQGTIQFE